MFVSAGSVSFVRAGGSVKYRDFVGPVGSVEGMGSVSTMVCSGCCSYIRLVILIGYVISYSSMIALLFPGPSVMCVLVL